MLAAASWPASARALPQRVMVVGDSLSAEYGLARGSGWVALMQKRIEQEHLDVEVVNASISGDTTSGGRARLAAALAAHKPTIVVIELGGNDALRGLSLGATRDNLAAMAATAKASGARVVLVGMQMPPNYGKRYGEEFAAIYAQVAKQQGASLVPFLLKGIADAPNQDELFQPDRIHPKAQAHPILLDNVWAVLGPMLTSLHR